MAWLAVSLAVLTSPPPSPPPWRLLSTPSLHVGVRPAVDVSAEGWGAGATLQITARVL